MIRPLAAALVAAHASAASAAPPVALNLGNYDLTSAVAAPDTSSSRFAPALHDQQDNAPLSLGPVTIEGTNQKNLNQNGLGVTASLPVPAVPGLAVTLNGYAGHDSATPGSSVAAGAVTLGLRLRF